MLHKPPGKDFEVYNDFNRHITNLYRCVRDSPEELKSDDEWYGYSSQTNEDNFNNLIYHIKSKTLYESQIEAEYGDHFITLSTCDYSQTDGRLIIIGVRT